MVGQGHEEAYEVITKGRSIRSLCKIIVSSSSIPLTETVVEQSRGGHLCPIFYVVQSRLFRLSSSSSTVPCNNSLDGMPHIIA